MKKVTYLFLFLLIAALLSGCLLQYFYITRLTDELLTMAEQLTLRIRERDLAAAKTQLSLLNNHWQQHRRRMYSLSEHRLAQDVDSELAAISEDLRNNNLQQLYSESARLIQALRALRLSEELTLSNLL